MRRPRSSGITFSGLTVTPSIIASASLSRQGDPGGIAQHEPVGVRLAVAFPDRYVPPEEGVDDPGPHPLDRAPLEDDAVLDLHAPERAFRSDRGEGAPRGVGRP